MRSKRSKQYRKLMEQYRLSFGFREPYQVLLDADIIKDADRFKMDLVGGLERTLHGKIKPMITQCSIRHLYAIKSEPGISAIIEKAKLFERRRCDHLPDEYPEPLTATECISSVVDPKKAKTNKHRYVVASQQLSVRNAMREVMGVPLIYINRSVMIMEPMADATVRNREREERGKFRVGIKGGRTTTSQGLKRKREDADYDAHDGQPDSIEGSAKSKKSYGKGAKGPNPLSVKKPKKRKDEAQAKVLSNPITKSQSTIGMGSFGSNEQLEANSKQKRRRKHKPNTSSTDNGPLVNDDNSNTFKD